MKLEVFLPNELVILICEYLPYFQHIKATKLETKVGPHLSVNLYVLFKGLEIFLDGIKIEQVMYTEPDCHIKKILVTDQENKNIYFSDNIQSFQKCETKKITILNFNLKFTKEKVCVEIDVESENKKYLFEFIRLA